MYVVEVILWRAAQLHHDLITTRAAIAFVPAIAPARSPA